MGMMYTLLKLERGVAVMRCTDTNAVLRFVANDGALDGVAVGSRVRVQALHWDNATKAVVCRKCEHAPAEAPLKRPRHL